MQALLAGGGEIDSFDWDGKAPLHCAVRSEAANGVAVIHALIAVGADVNAQDELRTVRRQEEPPA